MKLMTPTALAAAMLPMETMSTRNRMIVWIFVLTTRIDRKLGATMTRQTNTYASQAAGSPTAREVDVRLCNGGRILKR
jgi:hypothetical protein